MDTATKCSESASASHRRGRSRRVLNLTRRILLSLLAAAAPSVCAELYACTEADGRPRYTDIEPGTKACRRVSALPMGAERTAARTAPAETPAVDLAALSAAREDPDPGARLRSLEEWARGPRDSLDPLTHALVDPDETVRARAQELLEQAWQR